MLWCIQLVTKAREEGKIANDFYAAELNKVNHIPKDKQEGYCNLKNDFRRFLSTEAAWANFFLTIGSQYP